MWKFSGAFRCWFRSSGFFAPPVLVKVQLPEWLAAGIGLTLYMGCFAAEIFRRGITSIDKGQWQAARAIGTMYVQMMRHKILLQPIRRMIPPVVNQSVIQFKYTALLYVVAVPDSVYAGYLVVAYTLRPLEAYTGVAVAISVLL